MSRKSSRRARQAQQPAPQRSTATHRPPSGSWVAQQESASDRDRVYFEMHPEVNVYVRKRMPGEFSGRDGAPPEARYVEVEQIFPGCRIRRPIQVIRARDYPTGHIPFEHIEAVIDDTVSRGGRWRPIADDEMDPVDD